MKTYLDAVRLVLEQGTDVSDRTGVGTRTIFGHTMRFNLQDGFPAVTTKKLAWRQVVGELLWFLEGSMDERRLAELTYGLPRKELEHKGTIWTANYNAFSSNEDKLWWTEKPGHSDLGPVYGVQWRQFMGYGMSYSHQEVDQIQDLIAQIKTNPDSRRLMLTAWNPSVLDEVALPPCHVMAQFRVLNGKLYCAMYQRSGDLFLGVPFNIASYALLTHMIARECSLEVGELVHIIGDMHLYTSHLEQAKEQLTRDPFPLPTLEISPDFDLGDRIKFDPRSENPRGRFLLDDVDRFKLVGYQSHATIKADMAV